LPPVTAADDFDHVVSLLLLLVLRPQVWCDGDGGVHGGGTQAEAGSSWQQKHVLSASRSSKAGSCSLRRQLARGFQLPQLLACVATSCKLGLAWPDNMHQALQGQEDVSRGVAWSNAAAFKASQAVNG
jgi:hypothetical protein